VLRGWLDSVGSLVTVPEPHRAEHMDRDAVLAMLRCDERVLDRLLAAGLPCSGTDGERRFDRFDVFNLGMHSRSERSLPELAIAFLARLATEGREAWLEPRWWDARVELRCPLGEGCEGAPEWRFGRPSPERLGGRMLEWDLGPDCELDGNAVVAAGPRGSVGFGARLETRGAEGSIDSDAIRDGYRSVLHGYRFQIMPRAIKDDVALIERARVADCDGVSVLVADACRGAGHDATVEYGFVLGPFGFGHHTWVRVRDSDGRLKVLEPTLPMVAMLGESVTDEFLDFCCGSTLNRVVPCEVDGDYLADHRCGGAEREPEVVIRVKRRPIGEEAK
jgi:hypothetical protein